LRKERVDHRGPGARRVVRKVSAAFFNFYRVPTPSERIVCRSAGTTQRTKGASRLQIPEVPIGWITGRRVPAVTGGASTTHCRKGRHQMLHKWCPAARALKGRCAWGGVIGQCSNRSGQLSPSRRCHFRSEANRPDGQTCSEEVSRLLEPSYQSKCNEGSMRQARRGARQRHPLQFDLAYFHGALARHLSAIATATI
jgi:hypothetical protein